MANQPLAFAGLLTGGVLVTAALTGSTVKEVVTGQAGPFKGFSTGGGDGSVSTGDTPATFTGGILAGAGKIIGTPFAGTHSKAFNAAGGSNNWQSENAVDIAVPVGTPVYAKEPGTLGNTGSLGLGGRFAGLRVNLVGRANSYYYAHLSKLAPGIRQGVRVQAGQLLGYTGSANGVAHLHYAVQRGDPRGAL